MWIIEKEQRIPAPFNYPGHCSEPDLSAPSGKPRYLQKAFCSRVLPLPGWHRSNRSQPLPTWCQTFPGKDFVVGIFALKSFSSLMLSLMGQSACENKRGYKHRWIYSKCKLSLQEWPVNSAGLSSRFLLLSPFTAQGCWTGTEGGFLEPQS